MKRERKGNTVNETWNDADEWSYPEEEWFYDEADQIWKRNPGRLWLKRVLSVAVPGFSNMLPLQAEA